MATTHSPEPRPVGRPPDTHLEERVFATSLNVYGLYGWSATNLSRIASEGNVGKSTLYSRWGTKEKLLKAAFASMLENTELSSDLTVREWFISDGVFRLKNYLGPYRNAGLRLALEFSISPDPGLQEIRHDIYIKPLENAMSALSKLRDKGLIPPETSIMRMANAIEGSIFNRALWVTSGTDCDGLDGCEEFVSTTVDEQLRIAQVPGDLQLCYMCTEGDAYPSR